MTLYGSNVSGILIHQFNNVFRVIEIILGPFLHPHLFVNV